MIGKAALLKGAAGKAVKGFGTKALISSEVHLVGNLLSGEQFDQESYIVETVFGGVGGGVEEGLTGVALAGAKGLVEIIERRVEARVHEQPLERGEALKVGMVTFGKELLSGWWDWFKENQVISTEGLLDALRGRE